jgi:hypothetical protein
VAGGYFLLFLLVHVNFLVPARMLVEVISGGDVTRSLSIAAVMVMKEDFAG